MLEFEVARNPEEGSTLPYLVRLPLPGGAIVLKVRAVWSRTDKVYYHRVRPAVVADGLGEAAARFPTVPIVFAETHPLALATTRRKRYEATC